MTASLFAALALAVLLSGFVQGAIGMGFALIMAPLLVLLAPALVPGGLLVMMLPLNAVVMLRERAALDWHGTGWITAGRVAGAAVGLAVVASLPRPDLVVFVGIVTLATAATTWLAPRFLPGRKMFAVAGLVTGVTETATGIGGPTLAMVYQHHPAPVLRASIAACFLAGEIVSLLLLAVSGQLSWTQVAVGGALAPVIVAGAVASGRLHRHVSDAAVRPLVLGFAVISGLLCLMG